jgi:hypothetical protein
MSRRVAGDLHVHPAIQAVWYRFWYRFFGAEPGSGRPILPAVALCVTGPGWPLLDRACQGCASCRRRKSRTVAHSRPSESYAVSDMLRRQTHAAARVLRNRTPMIIAVSTFTNEGNDSVTTFKAADLSFIANVKTGPATGPWGACSDRVNFWVPVENAHSMLRF